ncbi:MAG: hypothetical protein VW438_02840 [Euryarchaeota archaeon]|jgi:hypothetical protein
MTTAQQLQKNKAMSIEFTYAIQPSYLSELTDHCYSAAPNMEAAKGLALRQAQDDATDMNIWKIPMGGKPMLWMRIYYNDPMNKPAEIPGDDGDLLGYEAGDVI